jgi:hypothetical protein
MSQQKKKLPAAASDTEATPRLPIVFSENVIVQTGDFEGSHFIRAGDPSPYRDISEMPGAAPRFHRAGRASCGMGGSPTSS